MYYDHNTRLLISWNTHLSIKLNHHPCSVQYVTSWNQIIIPNTEIIAIWTHHFDLPDLHSFIQSSDIHFHIGFSALVTMGHVFHHPFCPFYPFCRFTFQLTRCHLGLRIQCGCICFSMQLSIDSIAIFLIMYSNHMTLCLFYNFTQLLFQLTSHYILATGMKLVWGYHDGVIKPFNCAIYDVLSVLRQMKTASHFLQSHFLFLIKYLTWLLVLLMWFADICWWLCVNLSITMHQSLW